MEQPRVARTPAAGPIFRSLRVAVAVPESNQAEYWTAGAPRLRVTAYDSG